MVLSLRLICSRRKSRSSRATSSWSFKLRDIARRLPCRSWFCRALSRRVVPCRGFLLLRRRRNRRIHKWWHGLCRAVSRHVGRGCWRLLRGNWFRSRRSFWSDSCRDRSRQVASCRDSIKLRQLHDLRDVTCNRLRRHQIFVADCRRYFSGVEMPADAIALQTSKRSWVSCSSIAFCHLLERQGKVRVVVCRSLSRQVATCRDKNVS